MEHVRQLTELEINSRAEEVFTAMSPRCTIEEMGTCAATHRIRD